MRLLHRDLRPFVLYPAVPTGDTYEGTGVEYPEKAARFKGHLQPLAGNKQGFHEAYGLDPRYAFLLLTNAVSVAFRENDRFADGKKFYTIKSIERWPAHMRILAEEVRSDGG